MNCLSCLIVASSLSLHVNSLPFYRFDRRNFISCMHMHIWAWYIHAHQIFNQCDLHFQMTAILLFFLYLSLLPTWFNLELSYLAQLCICSWVTHTEGIMHLWLIFLKLQLKNYTFCTF